MRGGVWKCGTHFTLDHAVSHQVLTEACPPVIHVVCSQLYNWVMAFESLFTLGIRVLQHFPTHCNLLPLTCNPFLLVSLCLRPMRAPFGGFTETPPSLQLSELCVQRSTAMVCDRVRTLSCVGSLWEDGFNKQTGARAAGHMREAVMETPLYTLQIKAKLSKCFSTHFQ